MKAKEYLSQIELADIKIKQHLEELKIMGMDIAGIRGVDYSADRVQTSPSGDILSGQIAEYTKLENKIKREINSLNEEKFKIIKEIHSLQGKNSRVYIQILFKRYVELKRLEQIAVETTYSYDRVRHLHGCALIEFQKQIIC